MEYASDNISFEVSFNERARNDKVYVYLEDFTSGGEPFEGYLDPADFQGILHAAARIDLPN